MFGRKRLPIWALVVVLILALAGLGLGYAVWSQVLTDTGRVNTGTFGVAWNSTFTDDGAHVDDPARDVGDVPCAAPECVFGEGARDPSGPGPNGPRYDKAVGACASWITQEEGYLILHWQVDNAYPSYYCTVWADIRNTGSIPVKIQARSLASDPQIETGFIGGDYAFTCGDQIDPGGENALLPIGMWIHVREDAAPGASYSGSSAYTLVNWNEWSGGACSGW